MEHITAVREDPTNAESLLLLGLIFEAERRTIGKVLRQILDLDEAAVLKSMDLDRFAAATRRASLEAIYRYPDGDRDAHQSLSWAREVIAMRAVATLRGEVATYKSTTMTATLIDTMRRVALEANESRRALPPGPNGGFASWIQRIDVDRLYEEDVEPLYGHARKQRVCDDAVSRLAPRQSAVNTATYWDDASDAEIARRNSIEKQTVYSTREQAHANLGKDVTFYDEVCSIRAIGRAPSPAVNAGENDARRYCRRRDDREFDVGERRRGPDPRL